MRARSGVSLAVWWMMPLMTTRRAERRSAKVWRSGLCLKDALEDGRVRLESRQPGDEPVCLTGRNAERDLVCNGCHEVSFSVEPRDDALGKEERGYEDTALVAQLGDGLGNGGLAGRPPGP